MSLGGAGRRVGVMSADSRSLWNVSLSPGWTQDEAATLRLLLMFYGVGSWSSITRSGRLPGKTQAQIFLQTQRMLGQQSLAEFKGLKLRVEEVFEANSKREGLRKNGGVLINTGNNATPAEVAVKLAQNQKLYGLTEAEIEALELPPVPIDPVVERQRQLARLHRLQAVLEFAEARQAELAAAEGTEGAVAEDGGDGDMTEMAEGDTALPQAGASPEEGGGARKRASSSSAASGRTATKQARRR
jgi:hypothetical protein